MDTSQISVYFNEFLTVMKPTSIADFMAYAIFLFAFISAVMLPDGNSMAQYLLYGTVILAIFDVTIGQTWYTDPDELKAFPAFVARICLFLLPFIAAGASRIRGKKGKLAPIFCIFAGLIGLFYAIIGFIAYPTITANTFFQ